MERNNLHVAIIILVVAFVLVSLGFYFQSTANSGHVPVVLSEPAVVIINVLLIIVVVVSIILVRNLFLLERQEKHIKLQEFYFERLQELVTVTRAQRHDFVNHLQAVYALIKTGQTGKAQDYIETLYDDVRISGELMHLNIPQLSALLLVKMGIASLKNISFTVEIESNLKRLQIEPIELNSVIGNLVDNALEAVEPLTADKREVTLRIFETGNHFVFQTINPGFIKKDLMAKIFEPDFSTKRGERGIGLASVKSVVEMNRGKILVSSGQDRGTKFTVMFSKKQKASRLVNL